MVGAGSSTPVEGQSRYKLPRGCTPSQKSAIEANPTGLLGRFGLCVLPTNTWQCFGKAFSREENEWRRRGIDDRNRQTEATLGGLHSFATCYGKGNAQKHSDFKSTICQRVYTTFKLRDPNEEWWLDICCGGGTRQLVAAKCGLKSLGLDLRPECAADGKQAADRLGLSTRAHFHQGDMRSVPDTVSRWKQQFHQQQLQHPCEQQQRVRFGGMFTSIPFWKLETYDRSREHPRLLEHCRTFKDFVDDMRTSLRGTVDVLADNAWVLVHCGPMRDNGRRCDLAFEIKKILQDDLGLELIDEIVLTPPHNTNLMRAGTLYEPHCKLINANTRIVVAWKGDRRNIPSGSSDCQPVAISQPETVSQRRDPTGHGTVSQTQKQKRMQTDDVEDRESWSNAIHCSRGENCNETLTDIQAKDGSENCTLRRPCRPYRANMLRARDRIMYRIVVNDQDQWMRGTVLSRRSQWPEWPYVRLDDGDVRLLQCNRNNYMGNDPDEGCWRMVDDGDPGRPIGSCDPIELEDKQVQEQRPHHKDSVPCPRPQRYRNEHGDRVLDKQPRSLEIDCAEPTAVQKDPMMASVKPQTLAAEEDEEDEIGMQDGSDGCMDWSNPKQIQNIRVISTVGKSRVGKQRGDDGSKAASSTSLAADKVGSGVTRREQADNDDPKSLPVQNVATGAPLDDALLKSDSTAKPSCCSSFIRPEPVRILDRRAQSGALIVQVEYSDQSVHWVEERAVRGKLADAPHVCTSKRVGLKGSTTTETKIDLDIRTNMQRETKKLQVKPARADKSILDYLATRKPKVKRKMTKTNLLDIRTTSQRAQKKFKVKPARADQSIFEPPAAFKPHVIRRRPQTARRREKDAAGLGLKPQGRCTQHKHSRHA